MFHISVTSILTEIVLIHDDLWRCLSLWSVRLLCTKKT